MQIKGLECATFATYHPQASSSCRPHEIHVKKFKISESKNA